MSRKQMEEELNRVLFYKCPGIRAGDVLHYLFPERFGFKATIRALLRSIYYSLFSFCDFKQVGTPETLMLFSNSYRGREDQKKAFDNVAELIDNQLIITPSKPRLNLKHLKDLFLPFIWMYQMRAISAHINERILLACGHLLRAYYDCADAEDYIKKNKLDIKYLVSHCDVMPVDCFFVQKFKQQGVIIVTLQHGTFSLEISGWNYSASKSDYFLAESPASVDLAHLAGYKGEAVPVGSVHYLKIAGKPVPKTFPEVKTIGVFMEADTMLLDLRNQNIEMLQVVRKYCEDEHKKMMIKFHPGTKDIKHYLPYINDSITKLYWQDISAEEFGRLSDAVVTLKSSVFTMMLKLWIPTFLFVRKGKDLKVFPKTDFLKFSNADQLASLVAGINDPQYLDELKKCRSYNACEGCIRDNYIEAFRKIGIDTV